MPQMQLRRGQPGDIMIPGEEVEQKLINRRCSYCHRYVVTEGGVPSCCVQAQEEYSKYVKGEREDNPFIEVPRKIKATRKFHLGDILSIVPGYLVSPRLIDGVYDILNFMTGDNLFTHQLPRAARECEAHLLAQFPFLSEINVSNLTEINWSDWLADQVKKYGEFHEVSPIPKEDHRICGQEAPEFIRGRNAHPRSLVDFLTEPGFCSIIEA